MLDLSLLRSSPLQKVKPFVEQGVVSGGNFLVGILMARKMGMENYGTFMILWMLLQYFVNLHQAFIVSPLQTFFGKYEEGSGRNEYLRKVAILHIMSMFLCGGLLFILSIGLKDIFGLPTLGTSLYFGLSLLTMVYLSYDFLRKLSYITGDLNRISFISTLVYVLQIAVLFFGTDGSVSLWDMVYLAVGAFSIGSIGMLFLVSRGSFWKKNDVNGLWEEAMRHFVFARWLMATSVVQWMTGNVFFLASGAVLGNASVGLLKMAQNIMGILHVLFLTLENYIPSRASLQLHQKGMERLKKYLMEISWKSGVIVLATGSLLFAFAAPLMYWVYGVTEEGQSTVLQCFAVHYFIVFLAIPLRIAIRTIEKNSGIFLANIVGAVMASSLAWPLVRFWGLWGAMTGLMAVQLLIVLVLWVWFRYWTKARRYVSQGLSPIEDRVP